MGYPTTLRIESKTIGTSPRTVAEPETTGKVIFKEFGLPSAQPLRGGTPLADFIDELESDAEMASRLAKARRALAAALDREVTLRSLRSSAGLSQEKLAERANTTQSYIARIEAGTLDPGTDMRVEPVPSAASRSRKVALRTRQIVEVRIQRADYPNQPTPVHTNVR